jgi:hypothetical protein
MCLNNELEIYDKHILVITMCKNKTNGIKYEYCLPNLFFYSRNFSETLNEQYVVATGSNFNLNYRNIKKAALT